MTALPGRHVKGRCVSLLVEAEHHPQTKQVDSLTLELAGIPGTRHYGFTRKAGPREPWYKRGMEMRSGRQITIVSEEDLAAIASAMEISCVEPEWIGANVVTRGIPNLSFLPSGTRLSFKDATLVVEAQNAPCRISGKVIAQYLTPDAPPGGLDLDFPKKAKGLRGVVASVERAGVIHAGEEIVAKVPPQWLWQAP
jgi:hypothetical protein